jgi:hypothetical protein
MMKNSQRAFRWAVRGPILAIAALLCSASIHAQFRISVEENCAGKGVSQYHFDRTLLLADYTVMVTDYEIEPDLTMRLVYHPHQADLILADSMQASDLTVCKTPTRYLSTTIFVAPFVPQPDITIMLNRREWHYDYALYVDSKTYTAAEAAALFAVIWQSSRGR